MSIKSTGIKLDADHTRTTQTPKASTSQKFGQLQHRDSKIGKGIKFATNKLSDQGETLSSIQFDDESSPEKKNSKFQRRSK